jgi:hypothetical protein
MKILIIGHDDSQLKNLKEPYIELIRKEENYYFNNDLSVNSFFLSEYDQFFRFFDKNIFSEDWYGLFHYRCKFDLPNLIEDKIYVAECWLGDTIYNQFAYFHKEFIEPLEDACNYFKELTSIDALDIIKTTNILYYRNLFIANSKFTKEWYELSKQIAEFLVLNNTKQFKDRWIGYILERLFSVYVKSSHSDNIVVLQERFE